MKKLLLGTILCATILSLSIFEANAQQQDPVISKIIEIGQTDNQTMKHLDVLSNRFGGRLVGSDAYNNAADRC